MNTSHPSVLVVDDEKLIRRLLLEYLEDDGAYCARGVNSGEEGLAFLSKNPVDLCIVDMRLPGMDGEAFILAAWNRGMCRRFLLHTGFVDLVLSAALRDLGITDEDVFLKPDDLEHLVARIRALLQ